MKRIDEIILRTHGVTEHYNEDGKFIDDMRYLLDKLTEADKALDEFTGKHFQGGSKSNREDYVALGIPTADIYKLRQALQQLRS